MHTTRHLLIFILQSLRRLCRRSSPSSYGQKWLKLIISSVSTRDLPSPSTSIGKMKKKRRKSACIRGLKHILCRKQWIWKFGTLIHKGKKRRSKENIWPFIAFVISHPGALQFVLRFPSVRAICMQEIAQVVHYFLCGLHLEILIIFAFFNFVVMALILDSCRMQ